MKQCPKCNHMSAECNHYNGLLVCYNKSCRYQEPKKKLDIQQDFCNNLPNDLKFNMEFIGLLNRLRDIEIKIFELHNPPTWPPHL